MENFNFKVGDKVRLPHFEKDNYFIIKAISDKRFIGEDSDWAELPYIKDNNWQLYQPKPEKVESEYQELFNFLNQEHNLICTEEQMDEIILEVQKFLEKDKEVNKSSKIPEKVKLTKFYCSAFDDKFYDDEFIIIFLSSKERAKELGYKHVYTEKEFKEKFDVEI